MYHRRPQACHGSNPVAAFICWLLVIAAIAWGIHHVLPFTPYSNPF